MNWTRIAKSLLSLGLIALSMSFVLSCGAGGEGADGEETIYLYIFNGYVGSKSMSLYGPSGKIVTNLPYGMRTEGPILVDRNLGTSFKLVVDGAPSTIDLDFTLYELYPQETGTLLLKKRTGLASADVVLYRHVQSIAKTCRLVFDNALSVESAGLGEFGFVPSFELANAKAGGYDDTLEPRTDVMNLVNADPKFIFVEHFAAPGQGMLLHAGKGSAIDYKTGNILAHKPTEEYEACVIDVMEADDPDPEALAECRKMNTYTTHVYSPSNEKQMVLEFSPGMLDPSAPESCNAKVSIGSDFQNIFADGKIISEDKFSFKPGNHLFWVLYGRPVDPRIHKFDTHDTPFAQLPVSE